MIASEALPSRLLEEVLALLGDQPTASGEIVFSGADPVYRTTMRMGELGAAAIGAAALQASRLWRDQVGQNQTVTVDVAAAAAAMRSSRHFRHIHADGTHRERERRRTLFPTKDGRWIYLQRLLPHHRARQFAVLGCGDDDEAMARAIAGWTGADLEQAIVEAGACAALVRDRAEWSAHPQAKAVSAAPILTIERTGDSAPEPLPVGDRPLRGVRVLDLTRVLAGPTAARTLAEHGATVIRVNPPELADDPTMMYDTGHGKRVWAADLRRPDEQARFRALLSSADVMSQGYRPGALAELGLAPADVVALRPGIVCLEISAWGSGGPWASRRGFDSVVQAVSGMALAEGGDKPAFPPGNPLDYVTGYLAAAGVIRALRLRAAVGGSYRVRLSLARTGRWIDDQSRLCTELAGAVREPDRGRLSLLRRFVPDGYQEYLAPVAQFGGTPAYWDEVPQTAESTEGIRW